MKRLLTLLLFFTISSSVGQVVKDQYIFEMISNDSGFSFSNISSVTTDRNDMLWFGCNNGLYYYDTKSFVRYKHNVDDDRSIQSNAVNLLYTDHEYRLWVSTDRGLSYFDESNNDFERVALVLDGDFNIEAFVEYRDGRYLVVIDGKLYSFNFDNLNNLNIVNTGITEPITVLYVGDNGSLYIGCRRGVIYEADASLSSFVRFYTQRTSSVSAICMHDNKLYIGFLNGGIDVVDHRGKLLDTYRNNSPSPEFFIPSNNIRSIVKRAGGDIWVGTSRGVIVIEPDMMRVVTATPLNRLPRNSVYTLHVDGNNALWLGTWAGGIAYYNDLNYRFVESRSPVEDEYGTGKIHHFAPNKGDENTVWVASEGSGLRLFDYLEDRYIEHHVADLRIKSITMDARGDLWIGSIYDGIFFMDVKSRRITPVELGDVLQTRTIISTIDIDNQRGIVWFGTREDGLFSYDRFSGEVVSYNSQNSRGLNSNSIWSVEVVDGDLMICTDQGFLIRDVESGLFEAYDFKGSQLTDNSAYSTMMDASTGDVYIGTKEHGLQIFNLKDRTFTPFELNDSIQNYQIYNVLIDSKHRLWIATNNGVYLYSEEDGELKRFTQVDGLSSLQFHPGSSFITPSDVIFFGATNGFNYINGDLISVNRVVPSTFISNISINNSAISEENTLSMNSSNLAMLDHIELSHDKNTIKVDLVSNNVLKSDYVKFRYRLLGYEDKWSEISSGDGILFMNLPFGRYVLEVKSCNNDAFWGDATTLNITIHPPLYLEWYAIATYIILVILLIVIIFREILFKIKAKRDIELEQHVNLVNSRSFDEKIKFFMNISHELRTPLSLITAPLSLLERETTSSESLMHIGAIKRNTQRILRLTNQILDFRLLEVGKLRPIKARTNIDQICRETYEYFEYKIRDRGVEFKFDHGAAAVHAVVDADMVEKIIYNLLGNALKYSNEGSSVTLKLEVVDNAHQGLKYDVMRGVEVAGRAVVVTVEDNGPGIEPDALPHIFERFNYNSNISISSSGIGLHLCMEYVNLHDGAIYVYSKVGLGSRFTIVLPTDSAVTDMMTGISISTTIPFSADQNEEVVAAQSQRDTLSNRYKSTILIIDDNSEICLYLKKMLSRLYNCVTAKSGKKGIDLAREIKPHLIILDMLMPVMGGVECANKLREDSLTKMIPIIMLTGLNDEVSMLQGIKSGVDLYLTKPINEALLFAHVEQLLIRSNEMEGQVVRSDEGRVSSHVGGRSFVQHVEQLVESNIQNSMLDVNMIATQMQVSRSTLQRNFKSELNMGVAEFIRDYRLRSAVRLMDNGVGNIDEISICVGFNSTSYFCKAFKDKYGTSPKRYYDSHKDVDK